MGCKACQVACKQWNQLPAEKTSFEGNYGNPSHYSASTWTTVKFAEYEEGGKINWLFSQQSCLHCQDASCKQVCPGGAISHDEMGFVVIDDNRCIGCNYCAANCTFKVMSFDKVQGLARKCTLCKDRVSSGLVPACVKACPTGALSFEERGDIIEHALERKEELIHQGYKEANVYGLNELEGLNVMYVLPFEPQKYGLPSDPEVPLKVRVWDYLFKPVRIVLVIALVFALFVNRSDSKVKE